MRTRLSRRVRALGAISVALSSVMAALPFLFGRFNLVLATEALIWGIYALSFDLIFGYTGMLSFGQSIFFGFGAYTVLYSFKNGLGLIFALALAILLGGIMGLLVGSSVVRVRGAKFFLVTLVGSILFYLLALDTRHLTGGTDGMVVRAGFPGLVENYYIVFVIAFLVVVAILALVKSSLGLAFKMIRDNERRARLLGYSVNRYKIAAFGVGGALAGLAGGLYAYTSGYASAGCFHWTISADAVVWTILGGAGTVIGPFVGAALLTFVRDTLSSLIGNIYPVVVGVLLVFAVTVFPRGVYGLFREMFGDDEDSAG